jgi:hypothetical protein
MFEEFGRVSEVGFCDAEDGQDSCVESGYEVSIDQSLAWFRVRRGDNDEHPIGVGDNHSFDLVSVVGATPQDSGSVLNSNDSGKRPVRPRDITHEIDDVARDDGRAR